MSLKSPFVKAIRSVCIIVPCLMIAACSATDEQGNGPSLAADDLWDQIAEARKRPFPTLEDQETGADDSETSVVPLTLDERQALAARLQEAQGEFIRLEKNIQTRLKEFGKDSTNIASNETIIWRGLQLELSRLNIIKRDVVMITTRLDMADGQNMLLNKIDKLTNRVLQKLETFKPAASEE